MILLTCEHVTFLLTVIFTFLFYLCPEVMFKRFFNVLLVIIHTYMYVIKLMCANYKIIHCYFTIIPIIFTSLFDSHLF